MHVVPTTLGSLARRTTGILMSQTARANIRRGRGVDEMSVALNFRRLRLLSAGDRPFSSASSALHPSRPAAAAAAASSAPRRLRKPKLSEFADAYVSSALAPFESDHFRSSGVLYIDVIDGRPCALLGAELRKVKKRSAVGASKRQLNFIGGKREGKDATSRWGAEGAAPCTGWRELWEETGQLLRGPCDERFLERWEDGALFCYWHPFAKYALWVVPPPPLSAPGRAGSGKDGGGGVGGEASGTEDRVVDSAAFVVETADALAAAEVEDAQGIGDVLVEHFGGPGSVPGQTPLSAAGSEGGETLVGHDLPARYAALVDRPKDSAMDTLHWVPLENLLGWQSPAEDLRGSASGKRRVVEVARRASGSPTTSSATLAPRGRGDRGGAARGGGGLEGSVDCTNNSSSSSSNCTTIDTVDINVLLAASGLDDGRETNAENANTAPDDFCGLVGVGGGRGRGEARADTPPRSASPPRGSGRPILQDLAGDDLAEASILLASMLKSDPLAELLHTLDQAIKEGDGLAGVGGTVARWCPKKQGLVMTTPTETTEGQLHRAKDDEKTDRGIAAVAGVTGVAAVDGAAAIGATNNAGIKARGDDDGGLQSSLDMMSAAFVSVGVDVDADTVAGEEGGEKKQQAAGHS